MVITACLGLLIFNIIYYFLNQKTEHILFFVYNIVFIILVLFTDYLSGNLWLPFLLVSAFWISRLIKQDES